MVLKIRNSDTLFGFQNAKEWPFLRRWHECIFHTPAFKRAVSPAAASARSVSAVNTAAHQVSAFPGFT